MKAQHSLKAREISLRIHTVPLRNKHISCIRCSSLVVVQGSRPQLGAPAELEEGGVGVEGAYEKNLPKVDVYGHPTRSPLNLVLALKLGCTLKRSFRGYWCPGLTTPPETSCAARAENYRKEVLSKYIPLPNTA